MFFDTFIDIIRTREFIIILLIMLVVFPIIFAVASRSKKSSSVKRVPKPAGLVVEKKSPNLLMATITVL